MGTPVIFYSNPKGITGISFRDRFDRFDNDFSLIIALSWDFLS